MPIVGTGVYIRAVKDPAKVAKRIADAGCTWAAIGAVWQHSETRTGRITTDQGVAWMARELRANNVRPHVWGYPWKGGEDAFVSEMLSAADAASAYSILLDPEIGMNPLKSAKALPAAEESARKIVSCLGRKYVLGLSSYGNPPPWFPLRAFLHTGAFAYAGGQHYTVDRAGVAVGYRRWQREIESAERATGKAIQLVPNFGTYDRYDGVVQRRSYASQLEHMADHTVANGGTKPVGMIGWAENFLDQHNSRALREWTARP